SAPGSVPWRLFHVEVHAVARFRCCLALGGLGLLLLGGFGIGLLDLTSGGLDGFAGLVVDPLGLGFGLLVDALSGAERFDVDGKAAVGVAASVVYVVQLLLCLQPHAQVWCVGPLPERRGAIHEHLIRHGLPLAAVLTGPALGVDHGPVDPDAIQPLTGFALDRPGTTAVVRAAFLATPFVAQGAVTAAGVD